MADTIATPPPPPPRAPPPPETPPPPPPVGSGFFSPTETEGSVDTPDAQDTPISTPLSAHRRSLPPFKPPSDLFTPPPSPPSQGDKKEVDAESLAASMLDELDAELSGLGAVNTDGDELSRAGQPTSTSLSSWLTAPEAPLVYLILLFLGTLACAIYLRTAYPREHPDIEFTILFKTSFSQWILLLVAGLGATLLVLCWNVYLRLVQSDWKISEVKCLAASTFIVSAGLGASLFAADAYTRANAEEAVEQDTFAVLLAFVLGPPALLFGGRAAHVWHAGRFRIITGSTDRDRQLLVDLLVMCACVVAFAVIVAVTKNPQNALVVSFFTFILITSSAAIDKYMHTFRFDRFFTLSLATSATLLIVLVVLYRTGVVADVGRASWVSVATAAYAVLFILLLTVLVWRSQYWRATKAVVAMLFISMTLLLVLGIVCLTFDTLRSIGAGILALWLLGLLSGTLSLLWARLT